MKSAFYAVAIHIATPLAHPHKKCFGSLVSYSYTSRACRNEPQTLTGGERSRYIMSTLQHKHFGFCAYAYVRANCSTPCMQALTNSTDLDKLPSESQTAYLDITQLHCVVTSSVYGTDPQSKFILYSYILYIAHTHAFSFGLHIIINLNSSKSFLIY